MTPKEFRNFYLSFCTLYGCIDSSAALEIINVFYPDVTKKQLFADLKSRVGKNTRGYQIIETTDDDYIIAKTYYDFAALDMLFEKQGTCPFYVPDDLETFFNYGDEFFMEDINVMNEMIAFFNPFYSEEESNKELMMALYVRMGIMDGAGADSILDFLSSQEGLSFNEENIKQFKVIFDNLARKTRSVFYRGHTLEEMDKLGNHNFDTDEKVGLC